MQLLKTTQAVLDIVGVKAHDCHPELPRDNEYHGIGLGGGALSIEESMMIAGILYSVKPDKVIELGTSNGASTILIGAILKDIGKGFLETVDLAPSPPTKAVDIASRFDLPIAWFSDNSLDFMMKYKVDTAKKYFVFSDTEIKIRPIEVKITLERFPNGTFIAVHDTSSLHPFGPMNLEKHLEMPILQIPSPRGLSVLEVRK